MTFRPSVYSFEIEFGYLQDHSDCSRIKKGLSCALLPIQNRCHAGCQILSLRISHLFQLCSLDFGLVANDLAEGIAFDKNWLITMTLWPCSLPFHVQVQIRVGLTGFQPCLCFCRWVPPLHHHPQKHVTMRLGSRVSTFVWQVCSKII